jgi:drug/metabolite transporter (DMT)-like permease
VTGIYLYLLPPYGVALAWLMLGEQPRLYHLVGLVLVVGGVILATGRFRRSLPA